MGTRVRPSQRCLVGMAAAWLVGRLSMAAPTARSETPATWRRPRLKSHPRPRISRCPSALTTGGDQGVHIDHPAILADIDREGIDPHERVRSSVQRAFTKRADLTDHSINGVCRWGCGLRRRPQPDPHWSVPVTLTILPLASIASSVHPPSPLLPGQPSSQPRPPATHITGSQFCRGHGVPLVGPFPSTHFDYSQ
jgi:hypothetical protein